MRPQTIIRAISMCLALTPAALHAGAPTIPQTFAGSDVVVLCTVASAEFEERAAAFGDRTEPWLVVDSRVDAVWKGSVPPEEPLRWLLSQRFLDSYPWVPAPGDRYLVYANATSAGEWRVTDRCRPLDWALFDLYLLPEPLYSRADRMPRVRASFLIDQLAHADSLRSFDAAAGFASFDAAHIDSLLPAVSAMIRHGSPGDARTAALAVGILAEKATAAAADLEWLLTHGDEVGRATAFSVLLRVEVEPGRKASHVTTALADDSPLVRIRAIDAVMERPRTVADPCALGGLVRAISKRDPHPLVRERAAAFLARFGCP